MKRCPQCNRVETDEALKFCRVDGATLVSDSSSIASEVGTALLSSPSHASEVHASILPHHTNANVNRETGPTATLSAQSVAAAPKRLAQTGSHKVLIVLVAATVLIVIGITGYWAIGKFRLAGKDKAIESIAVLPFENKSGSADSEYLSDGLAE